MAVAHSSGKMTRACEAFLVQRDVAYRDGLGDPLHNCLAVSPKAGIKNGSPRPRAGRAVWSSISPNYSLTMHELNIAECNQGTGRLCGKEMQLC